MTRRIYLAGPDVFLANARKVGDRKQEICRGFGFDGLFPLDQDICIEHDSTEIFRANCSLMRRAHIGLVNLTPFRGPSADVGTIFELGLMFAQGKPVFGYASTSASYRERVEAIWGPVTHQSGRLLDRDGYLVENFGLLENLMVIRGILESGGTITICDEKQDTEKTEEQEKDSELGGPLAAFRAFRASLEDVRKWAKRRSARQSTNLRRRHDHGSFCDRGGR